MRITYRDRGKLRTLINSAVDQSLPATKSKVYLSAVECIQIVDLCSAFDIHLEIYMFKIYIEKIGAQCSSEFFHHRKYGRF